MIQEDLGKCSELREVGGWERVPIAPLARLSQGSLGRSEFELEHMTPTRLHISPVMSFDILVSGGARSLVDMMK